jgi:putative restriction endonuclease
LPVNTTIFYFAIALPFSYIRSMDDQIRNAAFIWLEEQTNIHGDVLPWEILHKGFDFMGQRIVTIGANEIWKPKVMELPLSITTSPNSPYN